MRSNNEAAMVTNYLSNDTKGSMINLQIMNRWMMRVPDVQKRVATRRGAGELDESMVEGKSKSEIYQLYSIVSLASI